jgi:hypothetical protein
VALGRCLSVLDVESFGLGEGSFSTRAGVESSREVPQQRLMVRQANVPIA